jgi:2-polyprenyl-6-methoxyphenol hydroxylase-like FAD-dependent oxidoreductase
MFDLPVLIVGAGPTGLNLALRLARYGIAFRIIDQQDQPARESRALAVHARTLEFYRQLGFGDSVVEAGIRIEGIRLHEGGRERAHIVLKDIGSGLSPYPFILDLPQDEHEHFLVAELKKAGAEVERSTILISFDQDDDAGNVVLERDGHEERARVQYVCGCDGARSKVREGIDARFDGGTYEHLYYVADVRLETPDTGHDFHLATGVATFALRLPSRKGLTERLIGFVPDGVEHPKFDDVRASAEELLGIRIADLNWFSTYSVHHRVADRFRVGRAFLLGDAGHLHSPVGGQGMNTGIGDAVNLAWKLADVIRGRASSELLDTYEPERIAFARKLVATTDRIFQTVVSEGMAGRMFRTFLLPTLIPAVTHFATARHALFRFASQIGIHYPDSALSEGKAGEVSGGDRLPWIDSLDNFAVLSSLDWQLHIYGDVREEFSAEAKLLALPLHRFGFTKDASRVGFSRNAAYLVRPDGYVALAMADQSVEHLRGYTARWNLRFG